MGPQGEQGRGLCEPSTEGAGTGRELGRWEKHVYWPRQHFHCCEVLREPPLCEHLSLPICKTRTVPFLACLDRHVPKVPWPCKLTARPVISYHPSSVSSGQDSGARVSGHAQDGGLVQHWLAGQQHPQHPHNPFLRSTERSASSSRGLSREFSHAVCTEQTGP